MTKQTKLHAFILATHGVLAMLFGLALLYVLAATRHDFLDVFSTVAALILGIAALLMVGLTDSAVACLTTVRQAHSRSFLIISALFFLAAAASLALYPGNSVRLLLLLAAVHAFARAGWSVFTTVKTWNDGFHAFAALAIAVLSASCGGLLLWASTQNSREAMTVLAVYTCFVGLLLMFYSLQVSAVRPLEPAIVAPTF